MVGKTTDSSEKKREKNTVVISLFILLHEKFLEFDRLRAVVFHLITCENYTPFVGSSINK